MPFIETDDGARLRWLVDDLTPPWVAEPPTILLHHGIGSTAEIWWRWLPELATRWRIVRFDARGLGRSRLPPGGPVPTIGRMTADVMAVAAAAGVERFHLVGDSMGGTVALHAAAHRPDAVLSVMAISAAWRGGRIERAGEWARHIEAHGMAGWSDLMMRERFGYGALEDDEEAWIRALQAAEDPAGVVAATAMLLASDIAADLPRIACPALLVYPDDSPFIRLSTLPDLQACWPGIEPEVIPSARHSIASSHALALSRRLGAFLDGHAGGAA